MGASPDPAYVEALIDRCAVEPDFYVRETLTWALIRHPADLAVPRLIEETRSKNPQARSQALHTLSKFRDARGWPAITPGLLRDPDDEVARSAWRAAAVLVPEEEKPALARELATQLGRGDRSVQFSLTRALVALGPLAVEPVLRAAGNSADPRVLAHVRATERLLRDPQAAFEPDLEEARRAFALGEGRAE